jgi:hypothetical protein
LRRSALVVLLAPSKPSLSGAVERELQSLPSLSLAMLSTAQGAYTSAEMQRDLQAMARAASSTGRLGVVRLAGAPASYRRLRLLAATRRTDELLLIVELASAPSAHELRWTAIAGLDAGGSALSSQSTDQRGIVAVDDVAPTVAGYLGMRAPDTARGAPIHPDGDLDGGALRALRARLEVVYARRLPALACLLGAWALLLTATALADRFRQRRPSRQRAGAEAASLRWGLRVGALAVLWTPVAALGPAALEPGATVECLSIAGAALALAALTDALLPWPRAPIAPAATAIATLTVDALAGTQLLMRSLLGPNPAYGARFHGFGNELKPALAVLAFAAVAAALYRADRSRGAAWAMAWVGALLALVEGAARIGAGVGGVILVCSGTAVASAMLLPGRLTRRHALAALAAPVVGLVALAAVDLTTAHGVGHFTRSVIDARSPSDVGDLIGRRYEAAWRELGNGLMPLTTVLALLLAGAGVRYRERLLAPVHGDSAWRAALAGGLTAGVVGALSEDSGPVLLVVAVSSLACVIAYLRGRPLTACSPGTRRATRSRALRRSTARAR